MPSSHSTTWLWIILGIALALRTGTAVGLQMLLDQRPGRTFLIEGDANGYWELAEGIVRGDGFTIYTPPRRVLRMPGFPALLAVPIAIFDDPFLPARLMLAGIGTLACGLVWWLAWSLFDGRVANVAAGLTAVSPVMVGFSPVVLSETAFAAALVGSLIAMAWWVKSDHRIAGRSRNPSGTELTPPGARARRDTIESRTGRVGNPSYGRSAIIGLTVGAFIAIACYMRPSWLVAGPLFGLVAVVTAAHKGRALVMAACVMVGLIGLLLPWGLRNQRVTGHFTLTTFWMGPSLYDGLNPNATGDSDMRFYDRDNLMGQGMSEYEVDRHYRDEAWSFVREQPGRTLQLAAIKLWRFLKPWPNAQQFGSWGAALIVAPFYLAVLALALRGWWAKRHDVWAWALTIGPLIYFAGLHMVFVSSLRYRLPAEYPLTVLAAIGAWDWRDSRSTMREATVRTHGS